MLPTSPITFAVDGGRFNYRAVAVVHDGRRVLLHRAARDDWWSLPGGRVEHGEPAVDTLRREMREELGVDVHPRRLLWVMENFFVDPAGQRWHEHALAFLVELPADSALLERSTFDGDEDGIALIFQWFPVGELAALPLYPTFFRRALARLPSHAEYVVHHDASLNA